MKNWRRDAIAAALALPFLALLILHASHYYPFISDDALISLRYAHRLIDGDGLTWTAGRPVEGYSNLLWVLLIAVVGRLGVDLIVAARLLGLLAMAIVVFAIWHAYTGRHGLKIGWLSATVASLSFVLAAPIAVWSIGGLEQPLCAALLAVSITLVYRIAEDEANQGALILWLSLVEGLLCLARPDGPIFAAAAAVSLLLTGWMTGRRRLVVGAAAVLVIPVILCAGQLVFRLYYYGEFLPNTALVKLAPSSVHSTFGRNYLLDGVRTLAPLSVLASGCLLGLLMSFRTRPTAVYLLLIALGWSGYVILIGGDVFPAYRHLVPLIVVMAFSLGDAFGAASPALFRRPLYAAGLALLVLVLFVPYTVRQFDARQNQRAVRERWEFQARDVGLLLKTAFARQRPVVAVTAAGSVPYWSELPALDMLGLNDYYLPRHRPPTFGTGWVGHELGDGRYVLNSRPDIIVFNAGSGPDFRCGQEMDRTQEFHDWYVPVVVNTDPKDPQGYRATVYIDRYSRKIGIRMSESQVVVPGFLFSGDGAVAYLDRFGNLVVGADADRPLTVRFDSPADQSWVVDVRAANRAEVATELRRVGNSLTLTLRSPGKTPMGIEEVVLRKDATPAATVTPH